MECYFKTLNCVSCKITLHQIFRNSLLAFFVMIYIAKSKWYVCAWYSPYLVKMLKYWSGREQLVMIPEGGCSAQCAAGQVCRVLCSAARTAVTRPGKTPYKCAPLSASPHSAPLARPGWRPWCTWCCSPRQSAPCPSPTARRPPRGCRLELEKGLSEGSQ